MEIKWTQEDVDAAAMRTGGGLSQYGIRQVMTAAVSLYRARASGHVREDLQALTDILDYARQDPAAQARASKALPRLSALAQEAEALRVNDHESMEQLAHALGWKDGGPGWQAALDAIGELWAKVAELEEQRAAVRDALKAHDDQVLSVVAETPMERLDLARAEVERLKAEIEQKERLRKSDQAVLHEYADRWKAAESRLAAIRGRGKDMVRLLRLLNLDCDDELVVVGLERVARWVLEGDAPNSPGILDGSKAPRYAGHLNPWEGMVEHTPLQRSHDNGSEVMRAACWEAVQKELHRYGMHAALKDVKAAIEGASQ